MQGIEYEEIMYDNWAYKFKPSPGFKVELLSCTELDVLDAIIFDSGELDTTSVVNKMHEEEAYKQTPAGQPISFIYAKHLSLE